MRASALSTARQLAHRTLRRALSMLPVETRFAMYRRLVNCCPQPSGDLVVKVAETADELQACFRILHDAYVGSGFMQPHPSGLRVTPWHALPTTTTICAKVAGEVVGTLSMVREGVFGLPLQSAFDLTAVRARPGQVAEISALAVRKDYRRTGGAVLFPLMKFMYEYCTRYFDTRHLLIAVNPNRIEMYESLLLFERLSSRVVENYAFANGAAAVGAWLDLDGAQQRFEAVYAGQPAHRDLHAYFVKTTLPQIQLPPRPYYTTNDPVMTPALLDEFFNRRTQAFDALGPRQRQLLHQVYDGPAYRPVLPAPGADGTCLQPLRSHQRHSIRCPGWFVATDALGARARLPLALVEISLGGCRVDLGAQALVLGTRGEVQVTLGPGRVSRVAVRVVRRAGPGTWGLAVEADDATWRRCVEALEGCQTYRELAGAAPALQPQAEAA
jgi:GNAT superfamily N-acetyltransferase